jgi:hypothetical protein
VIILIVLRFPGLGVRDLNFKKMKKYIVVLALILQTASAFSQVGIGSTQPDPSAQLDIVSQKRGLLIPRMTTAQLSAINSPAQSLLIYVTDGNSGFYYNASTTTTPNWVALLGSGNGNGWSLQGNLISGSEFIGTTNARDFIIKANNSPVVTVSSYGNVGINDMGNPPDGSAELDVSSTTKGLLIPRLTFTQRNLLGVPATSLLVYCTDIYPGFYYNAGTPGAPNWQPLYNAAFGWGLNGNSGTSPINGGGTDYIGTTGATDFVIATNATERAVFTAGGLLGIGIDPPLYKVHIATNTANDRGLNISNTAANGTNYGIYSSVSGTATTNVAGYFTATGATNKIAIAVPANGGRVGLGTAAPSYAVHIASSTSDDRALNIAQTGGGTTSYGLYASVTGTASTNVGGYFHAKNLGSNNYALLTDSGSVGLGTITPDKSAIVDISSTDKGLLIPRMSTTSRNLISNPVIGLMIYNTTTNCLNAWTGSVWKEACFN